MADHPDFLRPAAEALMRLNHFRSQNPIRATMAPAGLSPSPSPGLPSPSMSPTSSVPQRSPPTPSVPQFQRPRMAIPTAAYAPAYTSAHPVPQANHMPHLTTQSPPPQPPTPLPYEPQVYPEPLQEMTYIMVYDRVYLLLRDNLTDWWTMNPEPLQQVTTRLADAIVSGGRKGLFGPDGLQSLYQISMFTGREGNFRYICLAVQSEHAGLSVLLKGDVCENGGKDPLYDEETLALCKAGFDRGIAKLHAGIVTDRQKK